MRWDSAGTREGQWIRIPSEVSWESVERGSERERKKDKEIYFV